MLMILKQLLTIPSIFLLLGGVLFPSKNRTEDLTKEVWVFVLVGQSNMAGRATVMPEDTVVHPRVWTINAKDEVVPARDPLHFYNPGKDGVGPGMAFGKALAEEIDDEISILLIPTAIGGTHVQQWLNDSVVDHTPLYTNFMRKVWLGRTYGKIRGILWHQGESDATEERIPEYKQRLGEVFTEFRKRSRNDNLPIMLGELGSFSRNNESWQKINAEIRAYVAEDPNAYLVSAADLQHLGDFKHFRREDYQELGRRYAAAYLKILNLE